MRHNTTAHHNVPLQGIHLQGPFYNGSEYTLDDILHGDVFSDLGQDLRGGKHGAVASDLDVIPGFLCESVEFLKRNL